MRPEVSRGRLPKLLDLLTGFGDEALKALHLGLQPLAPGLSLHCDGSVSLFQFAMDEGAVDANPVAKVPAPKRRADPENVFAEAKRRALTPEEAGRLLACFRCTGGTT